MILLFINVSFQKQFIAAGALEVAFSWDLCNVIQLTLVMVDSFVGGKMSIITSNSTISGEIHAKIDNRSSKSVHYNEKFHYYGVHYYERRLYVCM